MCTYDLCLERLRQGTGDIIYPQHIPHVAPQFDTRRMDKQNATQCQGGCGQPLPQRADAPAQRRHAGRRKGLGGRHSNRGEIGNAAHFSNTVFGSALYLKIGGPRSWEVGNRKKK